MQEYSDKLNQIDETLTCLKLFLEHLVNNLNSSIDQGDIQEVNTFQQDVKVTTDKIIQQMQFKQYLENHMGEH